MTTWSCSIFASLLFSSSPSSVYWIPILLRLVKSHSLHENAPLLLRSLVHALSLILVKSLYVWIVLNLQVVIGSITWCWCRICCYFQRLVLTCIDIFRDWNPLGTTPVYFLPYLLLGSPPLYSPVPHMDLTPSQPHRSSVTLISFASFHQSLWAAYILLSEALSKLLFASSSFRSMSKYCYFKGNWRS